MQLAVGSALHGLDGKHWHRCNRPRYHACHEADVRRVERDLSAIRRYEPACCEIECSAATLELRWVEHIFRERWDVHTVLDFQRAARVRMLDLDGSDHRTVVPVLATYTGDTHWRLHRCHGPWLEHIDAVDEVVLHRRCCLSVHQQPDLPATRLRRWIFIVAFGLADHHRERVLRAAIGVDGLGTLDLSLLQVLVHIGPPWWVGALAEQKCMTILRRPWVHHMAVCARFQRLARLLPGWFSSTSQHDGCLVHVSTPARLDHQRLEHLDFVLLATG